MLGDGADEGDGFGHGSYAPYPDRDRGLHLTGFKEYLESTFETLSF